MQGVCVCACVRVRVRVCVCSRHGRGDGHGRDVINLLDLARLVKQQVGQGRIQKLCQECVQSRKVSARPRERAKRQTMDGERADLTPETRQRTIMLRGGGRRRRRRRRRKV